MQLSQQAEGQETGAHPSQATGMRTVMPASLLRISEEQGAAHAMATTLAVADLRPWTLGQVHKHDSSHLQRTH